MTEQNPFKDDDFFQSGPDASTGIPVGGNLYIQSADSLGSLTPTARAIMDELKDWHKRVEKHGSKEIHPSYLMTLDKVPEALNKYTSLAVQSKTEAAIHQAVRQIMDYDKRGQNRVAYVFPYLVRSGNKVIAKICFYAPQKESKTDAMPFRLACFRASKEMVDMILSHRAKKIRVVEEDQPGAFLFAKTKTEDSWLFPKLASLESEINQIVRKGFAPVPPIPIPEFAEDFIQYAREQKSVISILPDYHIIVDELEFDEDGSFKRQPEIINQYRAQIDGLEKFVFNHLRRLAGELKYNHFVQELDQFHATHIANVPPGRKQNSDKALALIQLVESFPFDKANSNYGKRVAETCRTSIRVIRKLMEEKDMILDRKDESLYVKLRKQVMDRIPEYTKNNNTLMKINFEEEARKMGIQDEKRIEDLANRLREDVCSKFSFHESKREDGTSTYYVLDHGYMAAVLHKLASDADKHPELKKQLEIAKSINEKLSNPKHPELNSKLRPEHIVKLSSDVREMERLQQEKLRSQEFQKKINVPAGLMCFATSILIFVTASYYIQSMVPIVFGVPFSAVVGVIAAYFFREKSREEMREDILASGKFSPEGGGGWNSSGSSGGSGSDSSKTYAQEQEEKKESKIVDIYRAADGYIFPKKFNNITDKVLDLKTMQKRIYASLKDIRRRDPALAREKDDDKVASTVEYALVQSSAIINFPKDAMVVNMPSTLYILKNDLKSPLFREQLADFYRDEMNKKKFDKQLVKYYTFLINTVEMEYYKYLPKKKL